MHAARLVLRLAKPHRILIGMCGAQYRDPGVKEYIDETFGGARKVRLDILCDFFKGGFDGSG